MKFCLVVANIQYYQKIDLDERHDSSWYVHCWFVTFRGAIVECLSSAVRDDILKDKAEEDHTISEDCRKQLKVELLERVSFGNIMC